MAVQFEENQFSRPQQTRQGQGGAVSRFLMKLGIAKNAGQANLVMIIIAVMAIGLAAYLMWPSSSGNSDFNGALDPTLNDQRSLIP